MIGVGVVGGAVATQLLETGACVAAFDVDPAKLQSIAEKFWPAGHRLVKDEPSRGDESRRGAAKTRRSTRASSTRGHLPGMNPFPLSRIPNCLDAPVLE